MEASDAFDELRDRALARPSYWEGLIKMRFANDLSELLNNGDLSQADLSRCVRKSPQYISKVLSGDQNLTIGTMVDLLWAFDLVPRIEFTPKEDFYALPQPLLRFMGEMRVALCADRFTHLTTAEVFVPSATPVAWDAEAFGILSPIEMECPGLTVVARTAPQADDERMERVA